MLFLKKISSLFSFVSPTTPLTSIPTNTSHSPQLSILFPQNTSSSPTQRLIPPNPHSLISTRPSSVSHQSTRTAPALSRVHVVPHFPSLPSTPASSHTSPPMSSHASQPNSSPYPYLPQSSTLNEDTSPAPLDLLSSPSISAPPSNTHQMITRAKKQHY
jgi:hypothetical protein